MFSEYDCFRLSRSIPDDAIPVGASGVVLMVFDGNPRIYEVEFPGTDGKSLGKHSTYTLDESFMERIADGNIS